MFRFALVSFALYVVSNCVVQGQTCLTEKDRSGVISDSANTDSPYFRCWGIKVPRNTYVKLQIDELNLFRYESSCLQTFVEIAVTGTNEMYKYCSEDNNSNRKPITALGDVNITFSHFGEGTSTPRYNTRRYYTPEYNTRRYYRKGFKTLGSYEYTPLYTTLGYYRSSFSLNYIIEDMICAQKNHFRCSNYSCIHESKVCDGVKDCENGIDEIGCETGILAMKGVNVSREHAITWLKNQRSPFSGWGKNTHRAVTALYLTRAASFNGQDLDEELMAKQLELQTSVALLRNSSDPLSVSELSMFVNALTVTCHNPRRFYGHDLVRILGERVSIPKSPTPGAYLSLCISNWTLSQSDIHSLLNLLLKRSEYPFHSDVQAVTVLALTCIKNLQGKEFSRIGNASNIYNATVKKFIDGQLSDGSFGNVHTTALITQALIASRQENNTQWNVTATMKFLMKQLNSSSVDFLSVYLTLPIFTGKTLVDMDAVNCAESFRKQEEEISDLTNKLGGKMRVQYSLYIGDQKDVIHTIYLRIPEQSSAYDVMRIAPLADPKYKFFHRDVSGGVYVYEIAGMSNDPEAGKFWLMYSMNKYTNGTIEHYTESPDKFMVNDEEHLIMWYKTADI